MRIHLDTNLLIQQPNWAALPQGEHRLFVSAIAFAEFSEGAAHPEPVMAARARIELAQLRSVYGEGLAFAQREADVYRELYALVTAAGRSPVRRRRVDLMIAAVAVADNAALATRNVDDFAGLSGVLEIVPL